MWSKEIYKELSLFKWVWIFSFYILQIYDSTAENIWVFQTEKTCNQLFGQLIPFLCYTLAHIDGNYCFLLYCNWSIASIASCYNITCQHLFLAENCTRRKYKWTTKIILIKKLLSEIH